MSRRGENIRKRKDGRWEARYIRGYTDSGKALYGSVYANSYPEAKRRQAQMTLSDGTRPPSNRESQTMEEILPLWLENRRTRIRVQTFAKYQRLIREHILPDLGKTPVNRVDGVRIGAFLSQKHQNGRMDGRGGLSPKSLQTLGFILKSAVNYAAKIGCCSPLIDEIALPAAKKIAPEVLSVADQIRLEEALAADENCRSAAILLSLCAGLRIGEVCGIRWGDLDFSAASLHVCRTVERIRDPDSTARKTRLILSEAKTASSNRTIPIPSGLIPILLACRGPDEAFILPGRAYPYTDPRTLQYFFSKYLKSHQIPKINYHALRHTFATRCIESGMDVKSLSEILGHSSVNITLNIYVHSSLEYKRRQLDEMMESTKASGRSVRSTNPPD